MVKQTPETSFSLGSSFINWAFIKGYPRVGAFFILQTWECLCHQHHRLEGELRLSTCCRWQQLGLTPYVRLKIAYSKTAAIHRSVSNAK